MDIQGRARKWVCEYLAREYKDVDTLAEALQTAFRAGAAHDQDDSVWILTREYSDSDTCLIQTVHRSQERAAKATEKHDLDPIYGLLTVSEWPVD